jgi:hypothetical protein
MRDVTPLTAPPPQQQAGLQQLWLHIARHTEAQLLYATQHQNGVLSENVIFSKPEFSSIRAISGFENLCSNRVPNLSKASFLN